MRRLAVPLVAPIEGGRRLDRSAVRSEMEELRTRAVAGEDMNQLQQEAYKHLHIQAMPPAVNVQTVRRIGLQGDEAKAFDLNPGEISPVLDLPAAFAIVKLESKEPAPLDSVRQEIEAALRQGRMQNELSKLPRKSARSSICNIWGCRLSRTRLVRRRSARPGAWAPYESLRRRRP